MVVYVLEYVYICVYVYVRGCTWTRVLAVVLVGVRVCSVCTFGHCDRNCRLGLCQCVCQYVVYVSVYVSVNFSV